MFSVQLRSARQLIQQFNPIVSCIPAYNNNMPPSSIHISPVRWQWASFSTLPKLPVPPLKQTLSKFLEVAKPIVSDEEFAETTKLVSDFGRSSGVGEKLQALLERRAKDTENWLSDWWLEHAYLDLRSPLPIVCSPGLSFPLQNFESIKDQIRWASKLVSALLKYKNMIDTQSIPTDTAAGIEMDMSQYDLLFGTNRVPGIKRDVMRYGCKEPLKATHIVVARKGNFFSVPVVSENGQFLNCDQIEESLKEVVDQSNEEEAYSIGLMTTQHRTTWGKYYIKLRKNPKNNRNLDLIESSIFVLCLDKPVLNEVKRKVSDDWETLMAVNCQQCLHGGGDKLNSNNRWFDKTLQFIVGEDGSCGMAYEHSPAEGPPVASLMEYAIDHVSDPVSAPAPGPSPKPEYLSFDLDEDIKNEIRVAAVNFDIALSDVDLKVLQFTEFGKNFPKMHNLSPDSFLQIAYQLAFYRMHGEHPPTYETGTLRKFKLGRTDTIRLPSIESADFVEKMGLRGKGMDNAHLADLCRRAIASHREYTSAACSGNGIDRHLLGLKLTAIESGEHVPKLLASPAYKTALHFKLSTSQVPTKHDCCMAFGPMYPDCYGICYNPQERKINIAVSAFHSFPETSASKFAEAIHQSLLDMKDIFITGAKAKL